MQIEEGRMEIDDIDERIVRLLNKRACVARSIFVKKLTEGLPIVDHEREAEVLRRVRGASTGDIDDDAVARIYRVIIEESRRMQVTEVAA